MEEMLRLHRVFPTIFLLNLAIIIKTARRANLSLIKSIWEIAITKHSDRQRDPTFLGQMRTSVYTFISDRSDNGSYNGLFGEQTLHLFYPSTLNSFLTLYSLL